MNNAILMGRLTADPKLTSKVNDDGTQTIVANYCLAVNDNTRTDYVDCAVFGKGAEFANTYLKKGTKIIVMGKIRTRIYADEAGRKHKGVQVHVREHYFAEKKEQEPEQYYAPGEEVPF